MKKSKRIFSIILSIALVLSTFSCGIVVNANDEKIESISYTKSSNVLLCENSYGHNDYKEIYDYETNDYYYEEFFNYYYYPFDEGDVFTINYSNGVSVDYILDYNKNFVSDSGDILYIWDDVDAYDNQYDEHWTVGDDNYYIIVYNGYETTVPVTIYENPVDHIEYVCDEISYYENTNGYFEEKEYYDNESQEWYTEFYYLYDFQFNIGDQLIVYNKDGSVVEYKLESDESFYAPGYEPIGLYEDIRCDAFYPQNEEHWYAGNTYYFDVECFGCVAKVPVSIVENPVDHIEFIYDKKEIIENTNGYVSHMYYYDEDDNELYKELFVYYEDSLLNDGDILKVFYKDGHTKEYICDRYGEVFVSNDGDELSRYSDFFIETNQYNNPWTLGNDNYFTIEYMGCKVEVQVSIVESPIESIEYTGNSREYIERTNGYLSEYSYYDEETGEEYYFNQYVYDFHFLNGDSIFVNYKDGTSEEFVFNDESYEFISSSGNTISATDFGVNYDQDEEWQAGNDYYFILSYKGKQTEVPVLIVESPIESIEYIPVKDIVLYENASGYIRSDEYEDYSEKWFSYNLPVFEIGDEMIVNYKNGKSEKYEYISSIETEEHGFTNGKDFLDDNLFEYESNQYQKPWTLGSDNYFSVRYAGVETQVQVTIVRSPVEKAEYKGSGIAINANDWFDFYAVFQHSEFEVYFKDGKSKTYVYNGRNLVADDGSVIEWYHINEFWDDNIDILEVGDHILHFSIAGAVCDIPITITEGVHHQYVYNNDFYDEHNNCCVIVYRCYDCDEYFTYNAEEIYYKWDSKYINADSQLCKDTQFLDVVPDGVINAKDYAYLIGLA